MEVDENRHAYYNPDCEAVRLDVVQYGSQVTKLWFNDDTPFDEQTNNQPKMLTYVKLRQTDGKSDEKRFGDFVAQWQAYANGNRPEDFPEDSWVLQNECSEERIASGWSWCIDGTSLGEGTLIATGNLKRRNIFFHFLLSDLKDFLIFLCFESSRPI